MEYRRKEVFETDGITLKRVFKKPEGIHAFVRAPACGLRVCHRGNSKAVWKVRKKGFRPKVHTHPTLEAAEHYFQTTREITASNSATRTVACLKMNFAVSLRGSN